jgi:amidohydrolase
MAQELKKLGIEVTENIGGTGVVGVYKNGLGPTLWLRADMDALPIQEESGRDYASQVPGVMHACGHDTHMAALIGYAETLIQLKNQWQGTLVFIVQPAEELGQGAKDMINDGLFKKFPTPDYVLGLHVSGLHDSGKISYTPGYALAAVDSIDIEVKGLGGHGAKPEETIDPVVLASKIVVNLQTLVSRNMDPRDPVVLTFGSIHGGTKHNIIPNLVHLEGTLRTYSPEVRKRMKEGIRRMSKALAMGEGAPTPKITFSQSLPATFNHKELTQRMVPIYESVVGKENVILTRGIMGAEDFSLYSRNGKYPTTFFFVGGAPKNRKNYGANHNSKFAPEYKKVLAVGVETMTRAVLELAPKTRTSARKTFRETL